MITPGRLSCPTLVGCSFFGLGALPLYSAGRLQRVEDFQDRRPLDCTVAGVHTATLTTLWPGPYQLLLEAPDADPATLARLELRVANAERPSEEDHDAARLLAEQTSTQDAQPLSFPVEVARPVPELADVSLLLRPTPNPHRVRAIGLYRTLGSLLLTLGALVLAVSWLRSERWQGSLSG